jgi:sugar phosphate isomerase/epimerase
MIGRMTHDRPSLSRRRFLESAAATAALTSLARAQSAPEAPSVLGKPVGLQLYSLRDLMPKDVPGTLAKIRAMGFREIEGGSDYKLGVEAFKAEVEKAGLTLTSAHFGYEDWQQDAAAQVARAKAFSLRYAGCAWIPHKGAFNREDCLRAAADFNRWGKAAKDAGLRYFYHLHGYEFSESPEGTLFDTLAKQTDPALVAFQADIFWVLHGGANPVKLFEKYPRRFVSTHLKDMAKGTEFPKTTGSAPDTSNVVLGTGLVDWPAVLRAAAKAGVERHFVEDEHPNALEQIPKSLDYLRQLKLT